MTKKAKKSKKKNPRANGSDGRNSSGQFTEGHTHSVGNKSHTNEKAKALKNALLDAITEEDIKDIGKGLVKKAKAGDTAAAKEIFDRLWGKAQQDVNLGTKDDLKSFIDWLVSRNGDSKNRS